MIGVKRRVVRETAATIREAARVRPIVVVLDPPGRVIGFRPKGTKRRGDCEGEHDDHETNTAARKAGLTVEAVGRPQD